MEFHETNRFSPPPLTATCTSGKRPRRLLALAADTAPTPVALLTILALAGALGVGTDLLFKNAPMLGINVAIWVLLLGTATFISLRQARRSPTPAMFAFGTAALVFAGGLAWRSAPWLTLLNLFLTAFFGALACAPMAARRRMAPSIFDCKMAIDQTAANTLAGTVLLLRSIPWRLVRAVIPFLPVAPFARGFVIAFPFLFIFGILFARADQQFAALARSFLTLPEQLPRHIAWILIGAWIGGGVLRMVALVNATQPDMRVPPERFQLGGTDAAVALGLLNVLFISFVLLQLPYLFGGMSRVADVPGLTVAQYARHGFFELATVATLVLPLLLWADWLLAPQTARVWKITFRACCAVLLLCVLVIIASALQRMFLYTQSYGLTQLRIYVSAFILMLAAVFAWLAATVLRGRRELFLSGTLLVGTVSALGLQAANPDALIAQNILQRHRQNQEADLQYLLKLSPDALPAIASQVQSVRLPNDLVKSLRNNAHGLNDWRSWNWSRAAAAKALVRLQP